MAILASEAKDLQRKPDRIGYFSTYSAKSLLSVIVCLQVGLISGIEFTALEKIKLSFSSLKKIISTFLDPDSQPQMNPDPDTAISIHGKKIGKQPNYKR
jgi:hypothetical protein